MDATDRAAAALALAASLCVTRAGRVDETYVSVRGRWAYLHRAIDKRGATIEFFLSPTRNAKAAKRLPRARRCAG